MADKKARFTFIDLLIILVIIAGIAAAGWKLIPRGENTNVKAVYTVMLAGKDDEFIDSMHIGDTVSISNKEKDTGKITKLETKPAESIQFNSIKGEYALDSIANKKDIFVTIESSATETDSIIKAGSTPVKVGLEMPVRGKGYASNGYVVALDTVEQGGNSK